MKSTFFSLLTAGAVILFLAACEPVTESVNHRTDDTQAGIAQSVATPRQSESSGQEEDNVQEFPITVDYFTPTQTEGPFYPVQKPEDRDNDLFILEGAADRPSGEIMAFGGSLYDSSGMPVTGP